MLRDVLDLMLVSAYHCGYSLQEIDGVILPAIDADRLFVMYKQEKPVGMFSYTFLTPEEEEDFVYEWSLSSPKDIWKNTPEDGTLYVMDLIAPYNNAMEVARFMQRKLMQRCKSVGHTGPWRFMRGMENRRPGFVAGLKTGSFSVEAVNGQ